MAQDINQAKRRILLLLIFAPGVFFVFYWAMIRSDLQGIEKVKPPAVYTELGGWADIGNSRYCVFAGEKRFLDLVDLGNNTAVPEPGMVFLGLGVKTDNGLGTADLDVIDSLGSVYDPIDIKREIVARNFGFDVTRGDRLYMFKVNSKAENFFFIIKVEGTEAAWRVKNTYRSN